VLKRFETTVGRALLSEILPQGLPFSALNRPLKKKVISRLINQSFRRCGLRATVIFADKLMQAGFRLATRGGISTAMNDMLVPSVTEEILAQAGAEVNEIDMQYSSVLVTAQELYNIVVDIWGKAGDKVGRSMMEQRSTEPVIDRHGNEVREESFSSIYMMADSGA